MQLEADDFGDQHRHRLAEHGRLGLDAADAPAEHAQAVNHRRVRIGADQRVGIGRLRGLPRRRRRHARQVFQIDLMHDAGVRRHDLEIAERFLAPAQEDVAFAVALKFQVGVGAEGERVPKSSTCTE